MTIISTTANDSATTAFKTSLQLQTPKPTTASVAAGLRAALHHQNNNNNNDNNDSNNDGEVRIHEESDPNEARYWMYAYGLGSHQYQRAQRKYAHPRKLLLKPTEGTAVVQQVLFGPAVTREHQKHAPLAVVGGPRVYLYGTNTVSAFTRQLAQHARTSTTTTSSASDSLLSTNPELQQLSSTTTTKVVTADRHVQTGGNLALSAAFRNDGRLLAVGTDAGEVRICDVTIRATLCTFETPSSSSKLPMRAVMWFRNGQYILSGGDDGILRVWNLSSLQSMGGFGGGGAGGGGGALLELKGHGDAIRAAALWQEPPSQQQNPSTNIAWNQLAFSGSYDHTIRVWDVKLDDDSNALDPEGRGNEQNRCLAVLSHGAPVEALLTMPSTNPDVPVWLLSAGGLEVKVWNPITGECVETVETQHRKTITTLLPVLRQPNTAQDESSKTKTNTIPMWRIVTGSLDGCIRIHQWSSKTGSMEHIHGIKVGEGAPITTLAVNETGDRLAIGTAEGMVLVRQRGPSVTQQKRKQPPRAGTYSFFTRGTNVAMDDASAAASNDFVLGAGQQSNKKRKLRKYDQCLKQFRYGDALDEALDTRIPQVVVAVLEELGKRRRVTGTYFGIFGSIHNKAPLYNSFDWSGPLDN